MLLGSGFTAILQRFVDAAKMPIWVELFCGTAGFCMATNALNQPCLGVDSAILGQDEDFVVHCDLTCMLIVEALLHAIIVMQWIAGAGSGNPCGTYSPARRGRKNPGKGGLPRKLRSKAEAWGLTVNDFTPQEQKTLLTANLCTTTSIKVLEALCRQGKKGWLENPKPSYLWGTPELIVMANEFGGKFMDLSQCMFGALCPKCSWIQAHLSLKL